MDPDLDLDLDLDLPGYQDSWEEYIDARGFEDERDHVVAQGSLHWIAAEAFEMDYSNAEEIANRDGHSISKSSNDLKEFILLCHGEKRAVIFLLVNKLKISM